MQTDILNIPAGFRLLTTDEVAQLLRVHRTTIYRMVEAGRLRAVRVGKARHAVRFHPEEIQRLLRGDDGMAS